MRTSLKKEIHFFLIFFFKNGKSEIHQFYIHEENRGVSRIKIKWENHSRSHCNILELKKVNKINILRAYCLFIVVVVEKITYLRGKSTTQKKNPLLMLIQYLRIL